MYQDVKKIRFTNGDLPGFIHVKDDSIGMDADLDVVYEGTVSYMELDPTYGIESNTMQTMAMSQAGIALRYLKPEEIDPNDLTSARTALEKMVETRLADFWKDRNVQIVKAEITNFALTEESKRLVKMYCQMAEFRDPEKAAKKLEEVQALAQQVILKDAKEAAAWGNSKWKCMKCSTINTGKFCTNCGNKREWTCDCGTVNLGRFCTECGKMRMQVEIKLRKEI